MKKRIFLGSLAIALLAAGAMTANFVSAKNDKKNKTEIPARAKGDKPVMTINGKDIYLSEFEYIYNKNRNQQTQPQSLDEYVDMFVNYKLKVADAEAAGLDSTRDFISEYNTFVKQLAEPYLKSQEVEDSLVNRAYDHLDKAYYVSHIMFPLGGNADDLKANTYKADSVLRQIKKGNVSFEKAAADNSIDSYTSGRGGSMGYMPPLSYPWAFEDFVYGLETGDIAGPVNSGVGLHLVRVDSVKAPEGEVLVEHILKLTQDKTPEQQEEAKEQIDSIYNLVKNGADFGAIAFSESEDPGSARQNGRLPWFGRGRMVKPFEDTAFELKPGEISVPIKTDYGYHIIKKIDARQKASLKELRPAIEHGMAQDARGSMAKRRKLDELAAKYHSFIIKENIAKASEMLADSAKASFAAMIPVVNVGGKETNLGIGITIPALADLAKYTPEKRIESLNETAQEIFDRELSAYAAKQFYLENAEYRNLVNEYRDGILLFNVSNSKVWEKASADKEGLEKYFEANRDKYRWEKPKYKGFIFFCQNDSLLTEALKYAEKIMPETAPADLSSKMQKRFDLKVRVERVIAAKGDNPISDYLIWNGPKPGPDATRWAYYSKFDGKILDQPSEAADVKNLVVADYQNELEKQWLEELHRKYPVKINRKMLKKVK